MNPQDHKEALIDALTIRAGIKNASVGAHPAAEGFAEEENVMYALAESCAPSSARLGSGPTARFVAGLNSNDFSAALGLAASRVIVSRLTAASEHRAICDVRELPNFISHSFPLIDTDPLLDEISESMEFANDVSVSAIDGLTARVRSFGKNVFCSRQLIKNDETELLFGFIGNVGSAAGRLEAKLVYDLIESNPVLGDQMSMFHADHGNLGAVAPLALGSLSDGFAALRNMLLPSGEKANLAARYIVVAPGFELYARSLLKDYDVKSVGVVVAPWIASTNWYLVADPQVSPTISLLYLKGRSRGVVVGKPRVKSGQETRDGVSIGIRFDVGAVPVGRVGIYKGRIG